MLKQTGLKLLKIIYAQPGGEIPRRVFAARAERVERTIIRQLHHLENAGIIQVTRPPGGIPIYQITEEGMKHIG